MSLGLMICPKDSSIDVHFDSNNEILMLLITLSMFLSLFALSKVGLRASL